MHLTTFSLHECMLSKCYVLPLFFVLAFAWCVGMHISHAFRFRSKSPSSVIVSTSHMSGLLLLAMLFDHSYKSDKYMLLPVFQVVFFIYALLLLVLSCLSHDRVAEGLVETSSLSGWITRSYLQSNQVISSAVSLQLPSV
jgi:glucan phosphoethanolaminetransferase (alkaline phosphatase superfamily)